MQSQNPAENCRELGGFPQLSIGGDLDYVPFVINIFEEARPALLGCTEVKSGRDEYLEFSERGRDGYVAVARFGEGSAVKRSFEESRCTCNRYSVKSRAPSF